MKKYFLLALVAFFALCVSSCEKYCSCAMPGGEQPETIEILPNEKCADQSPDGKICKD